MNDLHVNKQAIFCYNKRNGTIQQKFNSNTANFNIQVKVRL